MNIFPFTGRLAAAPELTNHSSGPRCRIRVIQNQYLGKDPATGEKREKVVVLPWTLFGPRAEFLATNFYRGDQIFIVGHVENNDYIPHGGSEADKVYGFQFLIDDFEAGAPGPEKRDVLARQRQERQQRDDQGDGSGY